MNFPHHEESERSLLGCLILYNSKIHDVLEQGLKPSDFYFPKYQVLFQAILDLHKNKSPVDLVTLSCALKERNEDELSQPGFLSELVSDHFHPHHVSGYIKTVYEKSELRRMMRTLTQLATEASHASSLEEFSSSMQSKILALAPERTGKQEKPVQEAIELGLLHLLDDKQTAGLMTGFHGIDSILNGLKPGNLMILAARPMIGKTAFAISLLYNLYQSADSSISFYSLEMSEDEIAQRMLSLMAKMNSKKLRGATVEFEKLENLLESIHKTKIPDGNTILDEGKLTLSSIRAKCLKKRIKNKKLDLVVIDYLQLLTPDSKNKIREQEVSEISRGLKGLAQELGCPILALSQLNRALESRPDKRPKLSDLRESGALEQDADVVAFLYRDEVYNKETQTPRMGEFIVAKNRHGETGVVNLKWVPEYTAFENIPESA